MSAAKELCEAQVEAFRAAGLNSKVCAFGQPNPNNPGVVFTGCPSCSKKAEAGVTAEEQFANASKFIKGLTANRPSVGTGQ